MNQTNKQTGFKLVLATAIISGISIFINKFGVAISDPYLFVGLKNLLVGMFFIGLIIMFDRKVLRNIKRKQWLLLILIGLLGGSIAFLLFFKGLAITAAVKAGFIHKSMFLVIAFLSILLYKKKPNKVVWVGVAALLLGNMLFLNIKPQVLNWGDLLVVGAVLLWSLEIMLAKRLLANLPARVVAGGRMVFGSLFIWLFLLFTGQATQLTSLTIQQLAWAGLTSVFLFGYVITFYSGLKYVTAVEATSILAIGAPITAVLTMVFLDKSVTITMMVGVLLIVMGLLFIWQIKKIKLWHLISNK